MEEACFHTFSQSFVCSYLRKCISNGINPNDPSDAINISIAVGFANGFMVKHLSCFEGL